MTKYGPLKNELHRMWGCEVKVIPVVIGSQGVVTKKFSEWLELLPGIHSFKLMQKSVLLGSENIMRKFVSNKS